MIFLKEQELIKAAFEARKNAYCPYSGYAVGAAALFESKKIYSGCNVENASYGACNCAERTAIFKAVSEGERKLIAIAIVGGRQSEEDSLADYASPCGICRQVISEFAGKGATVLIAKSESDYKSFSIEELLPLSFTKDNL